jgi:3-hydroxybutyrate dehydrogenase
MSNATPGALDGRHAVVTGGGGGIGAAVAQTLAAAGARVTLMGRDEARLRDRLETLPIGQAVRCDVTHEAGVAAAFIEAAQAFGPVAILVNNAGAAESAPFVRTSLALLRRMLEVNLIGTFLCSRAALPDMIEAGFGRIVNVASIAGLKGAAYVSAYCAAKHGVIGLTRALALETATKGITVNAVCPSYTDTDMTRAAIANIVAKTGRSAADAEMELVRKNPQGRLIRPEEVAATVLWLCTPGAEAITGRPRRLAVGAGEQAALAAVAAPLWRDQRDRARDAPLPAGALCDHPATLRSDGGARARSRRPDHGRAVAPAYGLWRQRHLDRERARARRAGPPPLTGIGPAHQLRRPDGAGAQVIRGHGWRA